MNAQFSKLASSSRSEIYRAASLVISRSALAVILPEMAAESTDDAAASVAASVEFVGRAGCGRGEVGRRIR